MKLLFESWRKYLKEEVTRTAAAPRGPAGAWPITPSHRDEEQQFSLPAELLPTLFKAFVGDPETFSVIDDKYDLKDLKNKDFEEVKHDKKYDELIQQMLYEPINTLDAIGFHGEIKGQHYKDFFDFVLKLPEEEKVHLITALAIYSDKWTSADIVGLLAFARGQIKLYGCLFHERSVGSQVSPSDYHHCRAECAEKCEAEEQECLGQDEHEDFCTQKELDCKDACKEEGEKTSWTQTRAVKEQKY